MILLLSFFIVIPLFYIRRDGEENEILWPAEAEDVRGNLLIVVGRTHKEVEVSILVLFRNCFAGKKTSC